MALNTFEKWAVDRLSEFSDVDASRNGVKADGTTDNTQALLDLANKYKQPTGNGASNRRVRIHLSDKGITRGALPMAPGIVWCGGEVRPPTNGAPGHIVYPIDPAWTYASDGSGAHRSGLVGVRINGEQWQWNNENMVMIPNAPTVSATSGSLASGTYGYAIGYKTSIGYSQPSDFTQVYGATGATISWTDVASWAQPVVWGRDPWTLEYQKVLAVLPKGTTTWTDDGSVTPSGPYWSYADLSASSIVMTGGNTLVEDCEFMGIEGSVFSSWRSESIAGEPNLTPMEAFWSRIKISDISGSFVFGGPHDSQWSDIIVSNAAQKDVNRRDPVVINGSGPLKVSRLHVWGSGRRGIHVLSGSTSFFDCSAEGSQQACLWMEEGRNQWIGGDVFLPASGARGIVINGNRQGNIFEGIRFHQFSSSTGACVDLTNCQSGFTRINGTADNSSGTILTGLNTSYHDIHILNIDPAGPGHVINQVGVTSSGGSGAAIDTTAPTTIVS